MGPFNAFQALLRIEQCPRPLETKVELARHLSSVQNPPLIEDFNEGSYYPKYVGIEK